MREKPPLNRTDQSYAKTSSPWSSVGCYRSFELGERLDDFTRETTRKTSAPITPFLRGQAFDPETVDAMAKAFVTTCEALGLSNRDDAMTELVAETIIELAQREIGRAHV